MSGNEQILSIEQLAGLTPEQVLKLIDDAWPWPLDAVQSWFENLYNQIQAWFYAVAGWTYNLVKPAIDAVWSWISTWSTWLWNNISPQFTLVWSWIQGIIAPIVAAIPAAISVVWDWINTAVLTIASDLQSLSAQIWSWTSIGFASISSVILSQFDTFRNTLNQFSTAVLLKVSEINSWFSNEFIDPFIDWLLQFPGKFWEAWSTWWQGRLQPIVNWFQASNSWIIDGWNAIMPSWFQLTNSSQDLLKWLAVGIVAGLTAGFASVIPSMLGAIGTMLSRIGAWLLTGTAGLGTWFAAVFGNLGIWIGLYAEALGGAALRLLGWFGHYIARSWVPLLASSAILTASVTGQLEPIIDKYITPAITGVFDWAEALGPVSPQSGKNLSVGITKLATFTVSGLAAMTLAGEALSPLKHIGLGHVAAIVYDLINYKTLTAAFMGVLAYVYIRQPLTYYYNKVARPEIPNEGQLIRLAGEYAIDRQTFTDYMQFHGYPDVWIDRLWELADRPFSPRMLTQLAQAGVIDDELIDRELHNAGYNALSIPYLKTWLRREADGGAKTLMASAAITRYTQGFDTEQVMRQNLQALGVADSVMDKYVFGANLSQYYDYQTDLKTYYVDAYHRRDIEEAELRSKLTLSGVRPERLDLIVEAQKIKRLAAAKPPVDEALAVQFDTIRDKRKKNLITHNDEIRELVNIGKSLDYATAIAENDDIALIVVAKPLKIKVLAAYETPAGKVQVDTIRTLRIAVQITRGDEISRLLTLAMPVDIATAIADNDDVTIALKPVKAPPAPELPYETDAGKLEVNNIRALRVDQQIDRATEFSALTALEMPDDIATAMADADDFKVAQRIEMEVKPVLAVYETVAGKLRVDTIRLTRRQLIRTGDIDLRNQLAIAHIGWTQDQIDSEVELRNLVALKMPHDLAQAYVDNDSLRLRKVTVSGE